MGPMLGAAAAAWARHPSLAPALADPDGVYLVLDLGDGRILHASPAGRRFAAALAASDGAVLARQIARACAGDGGARDIGARDGGAGEAAPRLARLRLDPRRIAPPVVCLVARGTRDGGEPAVLVVPVGPVTLPRPRPARSVAAAEPAQPEPAPDASPAAAPTVGDRFLWRSDASGALTGLTGADGLTRLVGHGWRDLAEAGRISGAAAMLAALGERRTFRAEPATFDLGHGPIPVALSGAPLGRGEAAFSGFGGFGVIRGVPEPAAPPGPAEASQTGAPQAEAPQVEAPEASAPPGEAGSRPAGAMSAADEHPATAAPTPPGAAVVLVPADPALSTDEHAAFREIARALGARYAGDDEGSAAPPAPRPAGGAVMPFPGVQPEALAPAADPAVPAPRHETDLLAGLPLPALLCRGEAILAANRPLLDLTGYADLASLSAAGLGRLFRGLPAPAEADAARRAAIETADGRSCPVEVLRGACTWAGADAACLILRPLGEHDPAGALTAERLAREAQAARTAAAEAALDALEAGVVTVDGAGRVVALNRAAAALFGCDPREVVGGAFAALFDAAGVSAVADLLRGPDAGPRAVSAAGRALTLAVSPARADGRRVAVLDAAPPRADAGTAPAAVEDAGTVPARTPRDPRGTALARLDRALRAPTSEIVALADAMVREPFGPLGDRRYRSWLAEIKASGERMLERVAELLDLAAVEAGALDLDPRPLALNDVVAGCVARLQAEAVRGRIVLRTSLSADLAEMEADERSVSRAACLVIEHAIRRSAAGGQVIVSTGASEGAGVALRVRDTGAAAARREAGSPGAADEGLALPRALVEANGGRLRLADRADGDGTLVEIILPARRAARA